MFARSSCINKSFSLKPSDLVNIFFASLLERNFFLYLLIFFDWKFESTKPSLASLIDGLIKDSTSNEPKFSIA